MWNKIELNTKVSSWLRQGVVRYQVDAVPSPVAMEALPLFTLIIKRCPLVPGLPVIITSEQSTSLDVVSTSIQHTKVIARPPLLRPYPIELRNMHDKRHQGSSQNFDFSRWTEQQQQQQKAAKMATEAQGRVQHAVEKMLDQVEKEKLRPLLVSRVKTTIIEKTFT